MRRLTARTITALILVLMAGGLLLLSQGGLLQPVEDSLLRPLSTLQRWISLRYFAIRDMLGSPSDIASLRSRNAQLEAEVARLEREVISLREQLAETEVLAALLGYARSQPESRYMAADVIGRDTSPFLRSIWIGRGSDSGIIRGMPVLTDRGLVGRVVEVTASTARVRLITDPETAVNVQLQDSRADGVLTPQLSGELWVDLIDQDEEISPGELVLTSGLGGGYPPGIPVGQVISVRKRDYELFQQAVIQPSVDFDQLEIVLVITNFRPLPVELAP